MKRINVVLDGLKAKLDIEKDTELANILEVTPAAVSSWRSGKNSPGPGVVLKISTALECDYVIVNAWCRIGAERDAKLREMYQNIISGNKDNVLTRMKMANQLGLFSD